MYLKSLTLRGFKSFASATTLRLEPGITCVVGPNGSGKSNVVDALSWVMGEQGPKSLRGGKMEDVVFAGTTSRPPLGRAEVTLTIDNSDGALPIEYAEVTISRLMFRSGQSEYAINGDHCRLLDVAELLSDSGMGREMHVIVGQGQLDDILHAGPEARRASGPACRIWSSWPWPTITCISRPSPLSDSRSCTSRSRQLSPLMAYSLWPERNISRLIVTSA